MSRAVMAGGGVYGPRSFQPRATFAFRGYTIKDHNGTTCPVLKPCPIMDGAIRWTVADQAWAVDQGFFVARSDTLNRVTFEPINPYDHDKRFIDQNLMLGFIERHVCFGDKNYVRLWTFLKQQDQWGYNGAWDTAVERFSKHMIWYKNHLALSGKRRSPLDVGRRLAFTERQPQLTRHQRAVLERIKFDERVARDQALERQKLATAARNAFKAEARERAKRQRELERAERAEIKARNSKYITFFEG